MALHTYGTMGVDWEERVRFDRLREERLARIKSLLAASELGRAAVLRHDEHPLRHGHPHRHLGAGQAEPLLPPPPGATSRSCGTSARRPATTSSTTRGSATAARAPASRRCAARCRPSPGAPRTWREKIRVELEERGLLGEPVGVDAVETVGAVRASGRRHQGRGRPAADAGGAHDQDAGRDHPAQHGLHDGRRRLRGALPRDAPGHARERVRRRSSTRCSTTWARSSSRASTRSRASAATRTRTSTPTGRCGRATPPTSTSSTAS